MNRATTDVVNAARPLSAWPFSLFTYASMVLSLFLAFRLEFDSPGAAALTAMVVARPETGDLLRLGIWRCIGTFAGMLAALALIALFAQSPWLFIIGFAAWMGLCIFVSAFLAPLQRFGIALAGFTPALIAAPALLDMNRVFEIAMDRMAAVVLGVLCSTLVFVVCSPNSNSVAPASTTAAEACRVSVRAIARVAWRDAIATASAVLLGCGFWITTKWTDGSNMLILFGATTALLVQNDDPTASAISFLQGMLIAAVAGFVCLFGMWPAVDGFPLFVVCLAPFVFVGSLLKANRRWMGPATAYLVFLMILISPENLTVYDLPGYLNKAYAFIIGTALAAAALAVLRPVDRAHD